jgi:hypothetical protein
MNPFEVESSRKLVLLLGLAFGVGCGSNAGPGTSLSEPEVKSATDVKVELPPPPSFISDIPPEYPDGTHSIRGLRKEKAELLGKEVKIKGYLLEVYHCPVCPRGHTCKPCSKPYFLLGDKASTKKEKALLVVDYISPKQRPPVLTVGKQYNIGGQFQISSPSGFGSSEGLLVFSEMVDDQGIAHKAPMRKDAGEAIQANLAKKREDAKEK